MICVPSVAKVTESRSGRLGTGVIAPSRSYACTERLGCAPPGPSASGLHAEAGDGGLGGHGEAGTWGRGVIEGRYGVMGGTGGA